MRSADILANRLAVAVLAVVAIAVGLTFRDYCPGCAYCMRMPQLPT